MKCQPMKPHDRLSFRSARWAVHAVLQFYRSEQQTQVLHITLFNKDIILPTGFETVFVEHALWL